MVLLESANLIKSELKIDLKNSYDSKSVEQFYVEVKSWLDFQEPESVVIKKRLEKGKFAGGASSFKIEGLIQLASSVPVKLVGGPELNRLAKKVEALPKMKKYQEHAYLAALSSL
jgi:hypothetical protein